MPGDARVIVFTLDGTAEYISSKIAGSYDQPTRSVGAAAADYESEPTQGSKKEDEFGVNLEWEEDRDLRNLNEQSDEIASNIEREISKALRRAGSVQAYVQFEKGSFVLEGTVSLLFLAGSTVISALTKEGEEHLSTIVKVAVQRVLNGVLRVRDISPIDLTVTRDTSVSGDVLRTPETSAFQVSSSRAIKMLVGISILILLLQVALLLDRYFDASAEARQRRLPTVSIVQASLRDRGYEPGTIDGVLGKQTQAAIRQFQKDAGLRVTGQIDAQLAEKLELQSPDSSEQLSFRSSPAK